MQLLSLVLVIMILTLRSNVSLSELSTEQYSLLSEWGSLCSISDVDLSCSIKQTESQFRYPAGIALGLSAQLFVTDSWNDRIQKFTADGKFITKWGDRGSGEGEFRFPTGIAADSSGNVYVADFGNSRIQKFTADGKFITKWGSEGSGDGEFSRPQGVTADSSGNVYVADFGNSRIQKFTADGKFITKWGARGSGDGEFGSGDAIVFVGPTGIAVDSSGNVYVADFGNSRIQKFTADGKFITKWGARGSGDGEFGSGDAIVFVGPTGIAVDSSGNVYVADFGNSRIQKFTADGKFITKWGARGSGDGEFSRPQGIALDSSGNVYVADSGSDIIQKFTADGKFITKWGSEGSVRPVKNTLFEGTSGIAVEQLHNIVYVTDTWNDSIQVFIPLSR
jgi:tripartite motif-containing protein 71